MEEVPGESPSRELISLAVLQVTTLHHLDRPMFLLGFLPKENRLYLIDKTYSIISYSLHMSVLEYVLRYGIV